MREKWVKNMFGKIIIEKFPNLRKKTDIQVQEAWGTAVRMAVIKKSTKNAGEGGENGTLPHIQMIL